MIWGFLGLGCFVFLSIWGSYCIVLADLELTEIHLSLPPRCWGSKACATILSAWYDSYCLRVILGLAFAYHHVWGSFPGAFARLTGLQAFGDSSASTSHLSTELLRLKTHAACFTWVLGIWTQAVSFQWQEPYEQSHVPRPLLVHLIYHRRDQMTLRKCFLFLFLLRALIAS